MKIQATLQYFKSTKGTHVYQDKSKNVLITSLYIKRFAFAPPAHIPKTITLTIEAGANDNE